MLFHDVRLSADKRKVRILALFDFSKAFDTVSHSMLLKKLAEIGFSASVLQFRFTYLVNRTQCVVDTTSNQLSKSVRVNTGVPQRSVLGPLLFTLFINDIGAILMHTKHIVYADDLQIYIDCPSSELNQGITKIGHDISTIVDYSKRNQLKLNIDKTKIMLLGSSVYVNGIDQSLLPTICIQ